jgi:hypothetical protein
MWDLAWTMSGVIGGLMCDGISAYAVLLVIFGAPSCCVLTIVVVVMVPYSRVKKLSRISLIMMGSKYWSALEFATRFVVRL